METKREIRVLVVDDSLVFREVLARGISSDLGIEVVAKATNAFDARDKILQYKPDVMTCDVQMPGINGIEFIKMLLPQYSIPVIVVSTISDTVFEAMNAGAVDFVLKPDVQSVSSVQTFLNEMIVKIKTAAAAKVLDTKLNIAANGIVQNDTRSFDIDNKIIAIGASTGGTEAICSVLRYIPRNVPGIVIVQHIPPVFSRMFAERLDKLTNFRVKEAETGDIVEQGVVLVAPGDYHMKIKKFGKKYKVECFKGERVNGHCPSVDVLFQSVAKEAGSNAIGIILTGMGYDGAKGLLEMKKSGARTIGQDENTSVVYGMPKVAYNIGAVEKQAPLERIPQLIISMLG